MVLNLFQSAIRFLLSGSPARSRRRFRRVRIFRHDLFPRPTTSSLHGRFCRLFFVRLLFRRTAAFARGFLFQENCVGSADSASNFFGRPRVARVARVAPTVSVESSFFSVANSFAAGFFVATLFSFLVAVVVFTAVGFFAAAAVAALFAGGDDGIWGEDCGEDGNCDSSVFRAGVFAGVFRRVFRPVSPRPSSSPVSIACTRWWSVRL